MKNQDEIQQRSTTSIINPQQLIYVEEKEKIILGAEEFVHLTNLKDSNILTLVTKLI